MDLKSKSSLLFIKGLKDFEPHAVENKMKIISLGLKIYNIDLIVLHYVREG